MQDIISWAGQHWGDIVLIGLAVCGVAAHITALTPTPADDKVVAKIRAVLDIFGGNYGANKKVK
jgi:hypothetical protein